MRGLDATFAAFDGAEMSGNANTSLTFTARGGRERDDR